MIRMMIMLSIAAFSILVCDLEASVQNSSLNQTVDDEGQSGKTKPPKDSEKKTQKNKIEVGFSIAFGLPYVVAMSVDQSRDMVVEAVYKATELSGGAQYGQVVSTGTLLVKDDNVKYMAKPHDRLVVNIDGVNHEFVIKDAQGNNQALTSTSWLLAPHILRYLHRIPELCEITIHERFDGARFTAEIKGWCKHEGARLDMNFTASGGSSGTRDYHGQETKVKYGIKGKVTGDGMVVIVNEQHAVETASATNLRLLYSMRGSASQFNATLNNVLRIGKKEYTLQNIHVQTESKIRGGVSSFNMNQFKGKVLEGGKPFGNCELQKGRAILNTSSGVIILELPTLKIKPSSKDSKK